MDEAGWWSFRHVESWRVKQPPDGDKVQKAVADVVDRCGYHGVHVNWPGKEFRCNQVMSTQRVLLQHISIVTSILQSIS